jgi:anti-anti-sigma factor
MVLSVKGRLDAVTSAEFENSLSERIAKGYSRLLINFNTLDYIGSAGLRSILATAKKLSYYMLALYRDLARCNRKKACR